MQNGLVLTLQCKPEWLAHVASKHKHNFKGREPFAASSSEQTYMHCDRLPVCRLISIEEMYDVFIVMHV